MHTACDHFNREDQYQKISLEECQTEWNFLLFGLGLFLMVKSSNVATLAGKLRLGERQESILDWSPVRPQHPLTRVPN